MSENSAHGEKNSRHSEDGFSGLIREMIDLATDQHWERFEELLERRAITVKRQWGHGCWLWLRAIATVRRHSSKLSLETLVSAHKYFKSALSTLDVELGAYIDGNPRRQVHWKLLQSIFLRDLVTIEAQLFRLQKHLQINGNNSESAVASGVVDLDDDEAFDNDDNNQQRKLDLIVMNFAQSIHLLERELQNSLQHFIGMDMHKINHLLLSESSVSSTKTSSFSFPSLKVSSFDTLFLFGRFSLLFVSPVSSSTPVSASAVPLVTVPDLLSIYLTLQSGFLDLIRDLNQVSIAVQMTRHFITSIGTIITFLSLMNQAIRSKAQQLKHNDEEEENNGEDVEADKVEECHRILSVVLHSLRRHRAVLIFKLTVLEQQHFQHQQQKSANPPTSSIDSISFFNAFEIEGYEEDKRKVSGLDQSYLKLDKHIQQHLTQTRYNSLPSSYSIWMHRLALTKVVCEELSSLQDVVHTRSIALPLTRDLFTALDVTPYNYPQSLYQTSSTASNTINDNSSTSMKMSWIVTSETDRVEVTDTLLGLYDLQSRACQQLILNLRNPSTKQQPIATETPFSYENLVVETVRSKYQAGLVALLWAQNMPETARRLLESAEEARKPLLLLLDQKKVVTNDVFETTLLCGDISFHVGLAYFQGGMLSEAATATLEALQCFERLLTTVSATTKHIQKTENTEYPNTTILGPYYPDEISSASSANGGCTEEDVEQVILRKRHAFSQLVWVYTALENSAAAESALRSLASIAQEKNDVLRLAMMIQQRLGVVLSPLTALSAPKNTSTSSSSINSGNNISSKSTSTSSNTCSSASTNSPSNSSVHNTGINSSSEAASGLTKRNAAEKKEKNISHTGSNTQATKEKNSASSVPSKKSEPLDGHFVISILILSLFSLAVLLVILRYLRWDEYFLANGVEDIQENDLFDL